MFIYKILKNRLLIVIFIIVFILALSIYSHYESFVPDISTINKSLDIIQDDQKDIIIKRVHSEIDQIQSSAHNLVDSWIPCLLKTKSCDKNLDYGIFGKSSKSNTDKDTSMDTYAIVPPITTDIVIPREIPVPR